MRLVESPIEERASLVPLPTLIGDVGGTNARFALIGSDGRLGEPVRVLVRDHATMQDGIEAAIRMLPERPRSAVLALAGMVEGDVAPLTNAPEWLAEPLRMITETGLIDVVILNDFEAVSLALPALGPDDAVQIGGARPDPHATRIAIGPGTGLGASALIRAGGRWVPVRGEGGHLDFGPRSAVDEKLWPHLERIGGRVSAEWLISGPGLVRIHHALAACRGITVPQRTPAELARAGLSGGDPLAAETLSLFATYLGRYAGDVALIFLPPGGVHIAGGIAPTMLNVLQSGGFRDGFIDKAPHRAVLDRIATTVITHKLPAFLGIAELVLNPGSFALDLTGRRWGLAGRS